uniref:CULLIN_2 domain-containing protein n=1 Tax=Heterorhabditis bacteriophora TaxID=37862 RepID=A0A1I7WE17_HETBA
MVKYKLSFGFQACKKQNYALEDDDFNVRYYKIFKDAYRKGGADAEELSQCVKINFHGFGMERELRLKAFMEEYSRIVQLFDDIVTMKESMMRLETYMIIMVCQVGGAMVVAVTIVEFQ